jgi:hypothetical protein
MLLNIDSVDEGLRKFIKLFISLLVGTALITLEYAHAGDNWIGQPGKSEAKSFDVLVPVEGSDSAQVETHRIKELDMFFRPPKNKPAKVKRIAFAKKISDSPQWTFSISTWVNEGETNWNHNAGSVLLGDPTSELFYKGSRAYTAEFQAVVDNGPWFARFLFGYGAGDTGELIDDDYLSAAGATFFGTSVSGEHRFSRTLSDASIEDMLYTQLDMGIPIYKTKKLIVSAFMGYQFWSEEYQAKGITQLECTGIGVLCSAPGTVSNVGQKVITNTANWHSMRLGLRTVFQVAKKLDFNIDTAIIPVTYLSNSDIHHLRTDLAKSPSIKHTGVGWGYNVEGTVRFNIYSSIFLKAGYRYWKLEVNSGDTIFFAAGGGSSKVELNKFTSYRHGGTVGLEYLF